jgi:hypothetical protein
MNKNWPGFSAIILAVIFCSFNKPSTNITFQLKAGVDKTSAAAIAQKSNWEEGTLSCTGSADIPCTITVDESFTHIDGGGDRVLNVSGIHIISINIENGIYWLGQQFKRIAAGISYIFSNKHL